MTKDNNKEPALLGEVRFMKKSNKEAIEILENYFMKQDPKIVAIVCAGLLIDINRLMHFPSLAIDEKISLRLRTAKNLKQLYDLVENESNQNICLTVSTDS